MERALIKLAQQLNQYDESSLMELWTSYANRVADFEPSSRWEEAALAFCMIQAVHWKNQLFNAELAASAQRGKSTDDKALKNELSFLQQNQLDAFKKGDGQKAEQDDKKSVSKGKKTCKVLLFKPSDVSKP